MVGVNVDMFYLDIILFHVGKNIVPGFSFAQIVIQPDETGGTEYLRKIQVLRTVCAFMIADLARGCYKKL